MSLRHPKASGADHRRWVRILLASAAVVLILAPGIAGAGAGTGGDTDDDAQMVADFQSIRDVTGEIDDGLEYLRAKGSGKFAVLAGKITIQSGRVRMTYNDLYERQPDGSVLLAVNQIAFR